jgi:hypothetical protein
MAPASELEKYFDSVTLTEVEAGPLGDLSGEAAARPILFVSRVPGLAPSSSHQHEIHR